MNKKIYFKSPNLELSKSEDANEYYKNAGKLSSENINDEFDNAEFDKEIKLAVSSYIKNFDNIVCFIGTGASIVLTEENYPYKNYGHTIKMLADRVFEVLKNGKNQLKDDEFGVFTMKELVEKKEL